MDLIISDKMERFSPRQVQVGGLIGRRIELTAKKNLLAIDWEGEFLAPFRQKSSEPGSYVGLGKTMEGLVRMAYYSQDPQLLELRAHVAREVMEAQSVDGYLGLYQPKHRIVQCWDVHEMAYLMLALIRDWMCFHEERSLVAAKRLGEYLLSSLPADVIRQIKILPCDDPEDFTDGRISTELATLGIDNAMLALYRQTGEQAALPFCMEALDLPNWNLGIVQGRFCPFSGHIYAYLGRCLAQLELYNLTGDAGLLQQTHKAMEFLLSGGGLVITGTSGITECWDASQAGSGKLGETCATAYLIRILDKLLRLKGDLSYGDLQERSIYGALFAAQSPDGRRIRYYTPLEGPRQYFEKDTYCCPGNFRRIVAELPELVYYRYGCGLAVNLYTTSRLEAEIQPGLPIELVQETDYPNSGRVRLHLNPRAAATFPVRLRKPAWCQEYTLLVNGEATAASVLPDSLCIERQWLPGDLITLEMAMPWRLIRGFNKQQGRAAIMRGPMVFSLNPLRNSALIDKDLKQITIDPTSLCAPIRDDSSRPDGLGCRVKAPIGHDQDIQGQEPELVLTEFADPGAEATYFLMQDLGAGIQDELLTRSACV